MSEPLKKYKPISMIRLTRQTGEKTAHWANVLGIQPSNFLAVAVKHWEETHGIEGDTYGASNFA